jgi:chromosome partitioning protein
MTVSTEVAVYNGPHPEMFTLLPKAQRLELLEVYDLLATLPVGLNVTVGNLKGGVAKTTTVMYLALMLGLSGEPVLVVDGDATNRSAVLWQAATEMWPGNVQVKSWAGDDATGQRITGREMVERVRRVRDQFRHVIIDTGPQMREYLAGALKVTNDFIVCSSPYPMDTAQIMPSVELAAEVAAMKDDPLYVTVLLAKAKKNTNSLKEAFADLDEDGVAYFPNPITNLESYALSVGTVPTDFGEYLPVLRHLVEAQTEDEA